MKFGLSISLVGFQIMMMGTWMARGQNVTTLQMLMETSLKHGTEGKTFIEKVMREEEAIANGGVETLQQIMKDGAEVTRNTGRILRHGTGGSERSGSRDRKFKFPQDTNEILVPVNAPQNFDEVLVPLNAPQNFDEILVPVNSPENFDLFESRMERNEETSSVKLEELNFPDAEGVKISSDSSSSLSLAPSARLHAAPGEVINVAFHLHNGAPGGDAREFLINGGTRGNGPSSTRMVFPDQIDYVRSISELRPILRRNETRTIIMQLKIPSSAQLGSSKIIYLEAQPRGNTASGLDNQLFVRFLLLVTTTDPARSDKKDPECTVHQQNFEEQCQQQQQQQQQCQFYRWHAKFTYSDSDSGLRSASVSPRASPVYWERDNFLVGSTSTPYSMYWAGSCCRDTVVFTVEDVAGKSSSCTAGRTTGGQLASTSRAGLTVGVAVVGGVLVVVVILAVLAIVTVKRRRKAQLAEMRTLPQAR